MTAKDTFLQIYMTHRAALIDYVTPIVGSRASAEDVVQEAYIRFSAAGARERSEADSIAQPVGYLYRIVRNLALDGVRHLSPERAASSDESLLDNLPATQPSPEQTVLYRDELRQVTLALAELPERTRIAFEMHRLGGRTFPQIAAHLGISVGLAHHLVQQALRHCMDRLDDPAG